MSSILEQSDSGFIAKMHTSWNEFKSWMRDEHSIHPLNPVAPEYSEFIVVDSKIRLRCIHINPDILRRSKILEIQKEQTKQKRNSLSEEYWFATWNKPVRSGNCNCSFRKSHRISSISSQDVNVIDKPPVRRDLATQLVQPTKISNVENFIQNLVHETILEVLQELHIGKSCKSTLFGAVNFAFTPDEEYRIEKDSKANEIPKDFENVCNKIDPKVDVCKHTNKAKKPLIILFHGIGGTSDIWWIVIKSLVSRGYEIVAPDMLGHGYSSAPHKEKLYSFHNLLLQALAIFDNYLGYDENRKCILIGHSYGCSFATAIYHHRMELISHLILISGGGPTPLAAPVRHDELVHNECVQSLIQPLIFCGVNRSLFYSSRGKFFDIQEDNIAIPNYVLHFVKMGQNWPEGDAAFHRRIFVPTLLIHGLQDKQVTLVQECEMERTIPRSFLELIPNAGHMPMLETPEHLMHMILCFLDCWS